MNIEEKSYNPNKTEIEILNFWERNNLYTPEYKESRKKTFSIPLPPPNANGTLHLGHVSGYTYQDILARYKRLKGYKVLLVPGKDHASIQTEVVFEKVLEKKGIKKRDLGREEFYKQCFDFCIINSNNIRSQEKRIGLSADFSREKFTLDEDLNRIVNETFKEMFDQGLVYRGKRIINWCPKCFTALADIDTEYEEEESFLYYIKYGDLIVATTRPETIIADTAIAVNPRDKRYKHLIGKVIEFKSLEGLKTLPVIGDRVVDINFGTGVLKVTPGHSKEDFRLGEIHNLPIISVIDQRGKMTYGKYKGLKVKEARDLIVKELEDLDLIKKIEKIKHSIQICERSKTVIEPLISYQWFLKTKDMASSAIRALEEEKIHIHPKRQEKNYVQWLENLEDWCISRQLWWGQRIPVYYCGGKETIISENGDITEKILGCGNTFVSLDEPKECPFCKSSKIVQDEDIFDTWFSSSQWPYSVLGGLNSKDFKEFYPEDVMETGRDILFSWVSRMVMLSLYKTKKVPFRDVYLHGIVLDKDGQKQSKSKGNGMDPSTFIDKFGTDALRLSLVSGNAADQDLRLYEEKVKGFRNFINKIYNSARYILLQTENLSSEDKKYIRENLGYRVKMKDFSIQKEQEKHIRNIEKLLEKFDIGIAAFNIQNFYHHTYCDIYIEKTKEYQTLDMKAELIYTLLQNIIVMHPFIPFITENIYQTLKEKDLITPLDTSLMYEKFPL